MSSNNDHRSPEPSKDAPDEPEVEDNSRRHFVQGTLIGAAALGALSAPSLAHAQTGIRRSSINHYHLPAIKNNGPPGWQTLSWGYEKLLTLRLGWEMALASRCDQS